MTSHTSGAGATARTKKSTKRQTVDILADLQLDDPRIAEDEKTFRNLRHAVYRSVQDRGGILASNPSPTLYWKYRGRDFPLRAHSGRKVSAWRNLSPWMKVQIANLVLVERGYRPFKIHLHDDLRLQLEAKGGDQKAYLRDRLRRMLRHEYGQSEPPMFYFVVEDRDKQGQPTRPHAHGAIEIRPLTLSEVRDSKARRRFQKVAAKHGSAIAEFQAGRWAVRRAMRSAAGLEGYRARIATSGVDQARNVWWSKPLFGLINNNWVTYAFKHSSAFSPVLGENRVVLPYAMLAEARKLWGLIRG